jgi:hypothetical protein
MKIEFNVSGEYLFNEANKRAKVAYFTAERAINLHVAF